MVRAYALKRRPTLKDDNAIHHTEHLAGLPKPEFVAIKMYQKVENGKTHTHLEEWINCHCIIGVTNNFNPDTVLMCIPFLNL